MKTVDGVFLPDRIKYYILAHLDDEGKRIKEKSVNSMTKKEMLNLFQQLCTEDINKYHGGRHENQ